MILDRVHQLLHEHADVADTGSPHMDEAVTAAEAALGVMFPESFREYLRRWGWLSFGPNEYQGLSSTTHNVVATTQRVRQLRGLPSSFVVVCDHEGDEYVCLDTALFQGGECPVVIWDAAARTVSRPRADNFGDFLESDIRGFL